MSGLDGAASSMKRLLAAIFLVLMVGCDQPKGTKYSVVEMPGGNVYYRVVQVEERTVLFATSREGITCIELSKTHSMQAEKDMDRHIIK